MRLNWRLLSATLLLLALVGVSVALAAWPTQGPGPAGKYEVAILGPGDAPLWTGAVSVPEATALTVLEAAADEAGLALTLEEYPGMGTYVRAIGEHRAHGASGWIYEVREKGENAWTGGDRSAADRSLPEGSAVRWRWVDQGA